ncbi:MAG: 3-oxoacyl-ACP reductase FabG [Candidatus Neomarinimicrobiota bacterium]
MNKLLKDKVAIITGGANGIGKATAFLFSEHGAKITIVDINQEAGDQVVAEITGKGGIASFEKTNISNSIEVNKMMEKVVAKYGGIDILINNAGILADAQLVKMTEEEWDRVIDINLKGIFLCGQSAAKVMIEKENGGVIINTSSVVGIYGNFGQSNYVASKAGVIGMTKTWMRELGKYNIRVNAVAPGFIKTEIIKDIPEKIIEMMKEKTPINRLGKPEDIANAFLFLASKNADYITGAVLQVDGGAIF